jgi:hypothetical protein
MLAGGAVVGNERSLAKGGQGVINDINDISA